MIHIHTARDLDFDNVKFTEICFKYPEHKLHWSKHHTIVPEILNLHDSGKEVHVVTLSGYVFWGIIEAGLTRGTLKRSDLMIHYHRPEGVDNTSFVGPNLEMSAELSSHWDGGGQHISNVRSMMGFYKGDQVNKFQFDDFYKVTA
jgi:hypothetical protein